MLLRPCGVKESSLPTAAPATASYSTGLLKPSLANAQAELDRPCSKQHQHRLMLKGSACCHEVVTRAVQEA